MEHVRPHRPLWDIQYFCYLTMRVSLYIKQYHCHALPLGQFRQGHPQLLAESLAVGLDIGSETPAEIALSALSEIQSRLSGRAGGPLRALDKPLHDWPG